MTEIAPKKKWISSFLFVPNSLGSIDTSRKKPQNNFQPNFVLYCHATMRYRMDLFFQIIYKDTEINELSNNSHAMNSV